MKKEIMIAGFGGQGVMAIGKTIVEAGMIEDKEVSWVPSYGPEMRGGTSNCSVILSDGRIGAPIITHPTDLIAMNAPSLVKFGSSVQPGGTILINGSSAEDADRTDAAVYSVPCDEIAAKLGNPKVANMVMLGAYAAATQAIKQETLVEMIEHMFSGRKAHLIDINKEALAMGADYIRQ